MTACCGVLKKREKNGDYSFLSWKGLASGLFQGVPIRTTDPTEGIETNETISGCFSSFAIRTTDPTEGIETHEHNR